MKKLILSIMAGALVLGIAAGCGGGSIGATIIASEVQRDTSPSVAGSDITALVDGNSEFAFDMFQALKQEDGNLFYSPYSISLALAMTYAGARTETATEMADTLHFTLPQEQLHPAFNWLDLELISRGETAKGGDDEGFRLHIANAIWGQKDYTFLDGFLDTLGLNYGAGLRILDFINEPDPSRITINDWVSDETEGKIEDLIPQGVIDSMTRLVLTNAIYFNAAWLNQFDSDSTGDGEFNLIDGGSVTVPMMTQSESFAYADGDGYQAVESLYDGGEMSMVIMLPDSGEFESFENGLDAAVADRIIESLQSHHVNLRMPKFEYEYECGLSDTLAGMGMPTAFTPDADFSGMTGNRDLFIGDVLHKAYVSVDEEGTEAAAATAVIMRLTAMPAEPVQMTVDRPFIFLIRDIETGTILFVGRVMDPGA
ncbi:MAG: serpin family protein [Dehalococcoidia bacterium]